MLKEDWRQNFVLLLFCFLLREVLTSVTLVFAALGMSLIFFGLRPGKLIRNSLAILVFGSYWITYGKVIDPEIGLNFLTSVITLKILEKETVRDRYMIFFGLLLLISAGSLFERTLTYVFFFGGSFLLLITGFYSYLGQKWRLKDLGMALAWVFPLTFVLFFLVPRLLNPIPFQQNTSAPGEIGYTPDVNISDVDFLEPNQAPVFHASTSKPLRQSQLYWRANTLSYNDGWNWKEMIQDRAEPELRFAPADPAVSLKQSFRIFTRPEYFFSLDYPHTISYGNAFFRLKSDMRTLPQKRWDWVQRYEVYSLPEKAIDQEENTGRYLQVPLSRKEKTAIAERFQGKSLDDIQASIRSHFMKEQFAYSLSPGKSLSFKDFMEQKKIGFCSHYASATAIILRVKGIPSRLVSGFMGGEYNKYASFYLVSQNDAHVWVEAFSNGSWQRLDPTEWIAPNRIRLGGEAFMESVNSTNFAAGTSFFKLPRFVNEFKQWFAQWDFLFYQWLEEIDYNAQEAWFTRFKFRREYLFSLLPLSMIAFMLIYIWYLSTRKDTEDFSQHQELWKLFFRKMNRKGIILSRLSTESSRRMIEAANDPVILEVWNELMAASFQGKKFSKKELKRKIKKL